MRVVGDLPRVAVGVDEHAGVATPGRRGALPGDAGAGGTGLGLTIAAVASLVILPITWYHYPVALMPFAIAAVALLSVVVGRLATPVEDVPRRWATTRCEINATARGGESRIGRSPSG